jgi:hypothetical protein
MDRNYQNLALRQDMLDEFLSQYLEDNKNVKVRSDEVVKGTRVIKIGYAGVDDATINIFFKKNGVTTIQFKTGKNQPLGKKLADYLYETVDPSESATVNLSLKGIDTENIGILLDDLGSILDSDAKQEFEITRHTTNKHSTQYHITSKKFKDRVVMTHHHTTNCLQVQGRPLFCYRNISYSLAILLDQQSLLSVISCTSDEDKLLVREEVAEVYIESEYKYSFPRLEPVYKDLLISSYCVKLASPELPEYSMLLYADLRVLEGIIKETLIKHGKPTDSNKLDIGYYFDCRRSSSSLKSEHISDFDTAEAISSLESCYHLYRKQRHSLFHMSDIKLASRTISTLGEVMNLSSDVASKIEELYKACDKL